MNHYMTFNYRQQKQFDFTKKVQDEVLPLLLVFFFFFLRGGLGPRLRPVHQLQYISRWSVERLMRLSGSGTIHEVLSEVKPSEEL